MVVVNVFSGAGNIWQGVNNTDLGLFPKYVYGKNNLIYASLRI